MVLCAGHCRKGGLGGLSAVGEGSVMQRRIYCLNPRAVHRKTFEPRPSIAQSS